MKMKYVYTCLVCLALWCDVVQGAGTTHTSAAAGSRVTLRCVSSQKICDVDGGSHGWFRYQEHSFQALSRCSEVLAAAGPRVSVRVEDNSYLLTIADTRLEDSGNYVCFSSQTWRFSDPLVLEVTNSGTNLPASAYPSPTATTALHTLTESSSATTGTTQGLQQTRVNSATGFVDSVGSTEFGLVPNYTGTTSRDNGTRAGSDTMGHLSKSSEIPVVWIVSCAVLIFANAVTVLFAARLYRRETARSLLQGDPAGTRLEMKTWRPKKAEECRGEPMKAEAVKIPEVELHYAELDL